VADFGLARKFGSPLGRMTTPVVTLWYRAPELLLGETVYTTAVDLWAIGCIFGELLTNTPILQGQGELDQINKIFHLLGMPTNTTWPRWIHLPVPSSCILKGPPHSTLRSTFRFVTEKGFDLLQRFLSYNPEKRISAEEALRHAWFREDPLPKHPDLLPSWPSKAIRNDGEEVGDRGRREFKQGTS